MDAPVAVVFFQLDSGREPVRERLRGLDREDRRTIGEDIKTLQFQWPTGMPLTRKIDTGLRELRSTLPGGIARVFFAVFDERLVLLHGFIKKAQKTPLKELALAKRRLRQLRS